MVFTTEKQIHTKHISYHHWFFFRNSSNLLCVSISEEKIWPFNQHPNALKKLAAFLVKGMVMEEILHHSPSMSRVLYIQKVVGLGISEPSTGGRILFADSKGKMLWIRSMMFVNIAIRFRWSRKKRRFCRLLRGGPRADHYKWSSGAPINGRK